MKNLEHAIRDSYRKILWERLRGLFQAGAITIQPAPTFEPHKNSKVVVTSKEELRPTESITVMGSTETEYLALKRALIRAGCPHIRMAAQWSKGLISATIPIPPDRDRLALCIMKAGLIPHDTKEGARC